MLESVSHTTAWYSFAVRMRRVFNGRGFGKSDASHDDTMAWQFVVAPGRMLSVLAVQYVLWMLNQSTDTLREVHLYSKPVS